MRALRVGHIHPVSGPTIQDGILLVRDGRIEAVGPAAEVEIPEGAERLDFPHAHAYPGLVDALTTAFADDSLVADASFDAGAAVWHGLFAARPEQAGDLLSAGVTTAYVANRSDSQWRGLGAIVRPVAGAYELWKDKEQAAVQLRLTAGPGNTHALQRQAAFAGVGAAFRALEPYRKAFEDHTKALEKYGVDFAAYLEYHENKKGEGDEEPGDQGGGNRGRRGGNRGERGGRPGGERGGRGGRTPPAGGEGRRGGRGGQEPPQQGERPAPESQPAAGEEAAAEKPPERPKYPKEPPRDPAKEALVAVTEGALPLRVEAHRPDEVRAALALKREHGIPHLVLEEASAAGSFPKELADAGAAVVVTKVLPGTLEKGYGDFDVTRLPARLHAAGVAVAIASGSADAARHLPLIAAFAAGTGLGEAAALRAVTLTPAEILGIAADAGSLEAGKLADVVITSAPLFASDSRVLTVLSAGRTVFEAR